MNIDIQKLYTKYLKLNIPNPFSMEDIHRRLTETYGAQKVKLDRFSDLNDDPHAHFDQATGVYIFENKNGIEKLNRLNLADEIDTDSIHAWIMNSTQLGMSNVLTMEISIFNGMSPDDMVLGNIEFEEYIIMLYLTGYIQLENDNFIEEIRDLYKEGYYLRYFGVKDDSGKFLYKANSE